MAEEGSGSGLVIPIGIEDNFTPELERIVQRAKALASEAGSAMGSIGPVRDNLGQTTAGYYGADTRSSSMVDEGNLGAELGTAAEKYAASIEKAFLTSAASLTETLGRIPMIMQTRINELMRQSAIQMAQAGDPEYRRAQATADTNRAASQGAVFGSLNDEDYAVRANAATQRKVSGAAISAASAMQIAGDPEAAAVLAQQKIALQAQKEAVLKATQATLGLADAENETAAVIRGEGGGQRDLPFRQGLTPMGARRGARRNLGNISEFMREGWHGGSSQDAEGKEMNPEGRTGMSGAMANVGGMSGIAGSLEGPMMGYAGFMLGMYALNDAARFMMGMATSAIALQTAMAPLDATFKSLSVNAGGQAVVRGAMLATSNQYGFSQTDLAPIAQYATANYGPAAVPGVLNAVGRYAVATEATPIDSYNQLRAISAPYSQGQNGSSAAANLTNAGDIVVSTAERFGLAFKDVSDALQQVSLSAQASGYSLKQVATIIGSASQQSSLSPTLIANTLNQLVGSVLPHLQTAVAYGESIPTVKAALTPELVAGGNPSDILGALVKGATPSQIQGYSSALGLSVRFSADQLAVLENIGKTNNGQTGLGSTAGSTQSLANNEMETFKKQIGLLGTQFTNVGEAIFSFLLPALNDTLKLLTELGKIKVPHWASNTVGDLSGYNAGKDLGHFIADQQNGPSYTNPPLTPKNFNYLTGYGNNANPAQGANAAESSVLRAQVTAHEQALAQSANNLAPSTAAQQQTILSASQGNPTLLQQEYQQGLVSYSNVVKTEADQIEFYLNALKQPNLNPKNIAAAEAGLQGASAALVSESQTNISNITASGAAMASAQLDPSAALRFQQAAASQALSVANAALARAPQDKQLQQQALQAQQQLNAATVQLATQQASDNVALTASLGTLLQSEATGAQAKAAAAVSAAQANVAAVAANTAGKTQAEIDAANNAAKAALNSAQLANYQADIANNDALAQYQEAQFQSQGKVVAAANKATQQASADVQKAKSEYGAQSTEYYAALSNYYQSIINQNTVMVQEIQATYGLQAATQKGQGQIVAADQTTVAGIKQVIAYYESKGVSSTSAQIKQLDAQLAQATAQTNQDFITTQENHIQTMADIHQITMGQEIALLTQLENSPQARALGQPALDQIKQQIQSIYNQLANNVQFDLPANINVQGLYYGAKRSAGLGATGGYNDNRTITVNLGVNSSAQMAQVASLIQNTLGSSQQVFGTAVRRY